MTAREEAEDRAAECEGHPAIDCGILDAAIGDVVYCDGTCRPGVRGG